MRGEKRANCRSSSAVAEKPDGVRTCAALFAPDTSDFSADPLLASAWLVFTMPMTFNAIPLLEAPLALIALWQAAKVRTHAPRTDHGNAADEFQCQFVGSSVGENGVSVE